MGKDLKGKELGVGICQLKDGRYMARYTTPLRQANVTIFVEFKGGKNKTH